MHTLNCTYIIILLQSFDCLLSCFRMIVEIQGPASPDSETEQANDVFNPSELSLSLSPPTLSYLQNDLTPTASPVMACRRIISISNPIPVLKLVVEGLLQKTETLLKSLEEKLLLSVLEESAGILVPTGKRMYTMYVHPCICKYVASFNV